MEYERDEVSAETGMRTARAHDAMLLTLERATIAAKSIHATTLRTRHTPDARVSIATLRALVQGYALALTLLDGAEALALRAVDGAAAGMAEGAMARECVDDGAEGVEARGGAVAGR